MEATLKCRDWDGPRTVEFGEGALLKVLLEGSGFQVHTVLVLLDGKPVPENAPAEDGAEYEVIRVASGG